MLDYLKYNLNFYKIVLKNNLEKQIGKLQKKLNFAELVSYQINAL